MVLPCGLSCPWGTLAVDLLEGTSQRQLLPPGMNYRAICRWLLVLGLEGPKRSQALNQGWLPLVLGLEPLSKRYGAH